VIFTISEYVICHGLILDNGLHPQSDTCPQFCPPPRHWQTLIHFNSPWIYLARLFLLFNLIKRPRSNYPGHFSQMEFHSKQLWRLSSVTYCDVLSRFVDQGSIPFLWPNSIPLHRYTTVCLPIHQLVHTWVISAFSAAVNGYEYQCPVFV
jgi:hypothetical protein